MSSRSSNNEGVLGCVRAATDILDARACVLLVIDVQHDFCHPDGALGWRSDAARVVGMCENIESLRQVAARASVPVVFLRTVHRDATDSHAWRRRLDGAARPACRTGTPGIAFHACIPREGDIVVTKHRYSGFFGTELDSVLRTLARTTVLLSGTATNVCVESTARDACMLDYDVALIEDASCADSLAEHDAAVANIRTYFGTVTTTALLSRRWDRSLRASRFQVPSPWT